MKKRLNLKPSNFQGTRKSIDGGWFHVVKVHIISVTVIEFHSCYYFPLEHRPREERWRRPGEGWARAEPGGGMQKENKELKRRKTRRERKSILCTKGAIMLNAFCLCHSGHRNVQCCRLCQVAGQIKTFSHWDGGGGGQQVTIYMEFAVLPPFRPFCFYKVAP